ncbi:calcium/calmodulin-dependent protein kinase type IV-like isoform X2 [Watersipora subatra]|uniref:calcium/calmodulin-dependent protein kinase type IV-like isoform X2 n=1 Tax=Watersipora subatra TaxID=2589382 RepID=UPI00355B531A
MGMPKEKIQDYWIEDSVKDRTFEEFYTLGKELGKGATSTVYRCEQKGTGQPWAVKIINKKVDKKVVKTECGVLLKIKHTNVIRLKEIFETPTQIHLVLELVTGGELFDRIVTRGFYTEKDASVCVKEMLNAIKYLHENDVVHRDLKPENLLYESVAEDSPLKIADFGLSKIIGPEVQMQTVCGTPGYCAPEILTGSKYTPAVDMWSIGVITYILLCGYEPFYSDEGEQAMFKKILKCEYHFHEPWWNDISENAKDLVKKLLVFDPSKRLTASQALAHSWVKGTAKVDHMEETQTKLKQFNAKRKLRWQEDCVELETEKPASPSGKEIQTEE